MAPVFPEGLPGELWALLSGACGGWALICKSWPTKEVVGPREEGWAVLDTHRVPVLGLTAFVVTKHSPQRRSPPPLFMYKETRKGEVIYPSWLGQVS